jgi:hypothetical protein
MLIIKIKGALLPIPHEVEHQGAAAIQRYIDDKTKVAERIMSKQSKTTKNQTEE